MSSSAAATPRDWGAPEKDSGSWKRNKKHLHFAAWGKQSDDVEPTQVLRQGARSFRSIEIESAIEGSRTLVDLKEDWDDEGAKPIAQFTWDLAAEVLRKAARAAFRRFSYSLPAPSIGPCADGSIDLYWDTSSFKLLINIKPAAGRQSDFYGERSGMKLQSLIDPGRPDFDFLRLLVKP